MTAIPHAARALTSALGRFESASMRLLEAATGPDAWTSGPVAMAEMIEAKVQAGASMSVIKLSDAMMAELLNIQSERRRR